ncbi:bifunctional purine biosynthesis protein PurH [bacterium BMS3Bbin04]|nr:bifunctional purine biosynthesis protein PurH [bacterium BMS3Bbin04]
MSIVPIKRALISVTDKSRLADLAAVLNEKNIQMISTGGTAKAIRDAGFEVMDVSELTGYPEIFGGRFKTLHPKVHGGILMRRDHDEDIEEAKNQSIDPIDLVVINLYQFEKAAANSSLKPNQIVEQIDIGGPGMIRAAAKNHKFVGIVTSVDQYDKVIAEIAEHGGLEDETRLQLAADAFELTAIYDRHISDWFANKYIGETEKSVDDAMPQKIQINLSLRQTMRYGENPHQSAAFYLIRGEENHGVAACEQLHGKALSFNNLIDADIALSMPYEFDQPAIAILKHTTPSGVGIADSLAEAEAKARACDPMSAFGGIVGMNRRCDLATAKQINKAFTEVVVAPGYDDDALALLEKKKNLRLLVASESAAKPFGYDFRRVAGGLLAQDRDAGFPELDDWKVVTERQPTEQEFADLKFAWIVCKYVKSNAVCFVKNGGTLGLGAGQMSRVDAVHLASWKAEQAERDLTASVLASDAFFPFADGLLAAIDAGAITVIQPGGSVRDQEVIDAANERGVAMIFTGRRHFRHA